MRSFISPRDEPRAFIGMRRFAIVAAAAYGLLFTWGMYRRLVQVQRIDIVSPHPELHVGDTLRYDVITSGEVHNLIRLELVQGTLDVVLHAQWSGVRKINTLDPRLFRYQSAIVVEAPALAGLTAGPATLRLTVFGSQKLLRTPPPRVREVGVQVRP